MDLGAATTKIAEVTEKFELHKQKIEDIKTKYINKINNILRDLEDTINNISKKGVVWAKPRIDKYTKELQDTINNLNKKLQDMLADIGIWYEDTMANIKTSIVKGALSKMGGIPVDSVSESTIKSFTDLIPHPPIDSFLPPIQIELELPDVSNLTDIGEITLPRLEI